MPICPICNYEGNRLRASLCPGCGTPMFLSDGEWVDRSVLSPNVVFVSEFEHLLSEKQSRITGLDVVIQIPRRGMSYRIELSTARQLIKQAGSLKIALLTLERLFTDPQFAWKSYNSLLYLRKDFTIALAVVSALEEEEERRKAERQKALDELDKIEDVFA